jgi:hypothetical protein
MENNSENKFGSASTIAEDCITPYYHCFVNDGVSEVEVYNAMVESLKKCVFNGMNIDLDFLPEKLRINCQYYSETGSQYIPFIARVFRKEGDNKLLFEFQRRRGDATVFTEIYRECVKYICNDSRIIPESYKKEKKVFVFNPPEQREFTKEEIKNAIYPLLQMCQSKFNDVKDEALQAIASLSFENKYKFPMVELGFVKQLVSCLKIESEDIQRTALSSLKHLTSISAGREEFLKQHWIEPIEKIKNETKNKQMEREIRGILKNIGIVEDMDEKERATKLSFYSSWFGCFKNRKM